MKRTVVVAALVCLSGAALAEPDRSYIEFAVKQAHSVGFKNCDASIREAFAGAAGKHIRVWVDTMKRTESDQLQLVGAYGSEGDMVTVEMALRRVGQSCLWQETTTIVEDSSCAAYLSNNPVWKVESATGDILGAKNPGGVKAMLRPVGKHCVVSFRRGSSVAAN